MRPGVIRRPAPQVEISPPGATTQPASASVSSEATQSSASGAARPPVTSRSSAASHSLPDTAAALPPRARARRPRAGPPPPSEPDSLREAAAPPCDRFRRSPITTTVASGSSEGIDRLIAWYGVSAASLSGAAAAGSRPRCRHEVPGRRHDHVLGQAAVMADATAVSAQSRAGRWQRFSIPCTHCQHPPHPHRPYTITRSPSEPPPAPGPSPATVPAVSCPSVNGSGRRHLPSATPYGAGRCGRARHPPSAAPHPARDGIGDRHRLGLALPSAPAGPPAWSPFGGPSPARPTLLPDSTSPQLRYNSLLPGS